MIGWGQVSCVPLFCYVTASWSQLYIWDSTWLSCICPTVWRFTGLQQQQTTAKKCTGQIINSSDVYRYNIQMMISRQKSSLDVLISNYLETLLLRLFSKLASILAQVLWVHVSELVRTALWPTLELWHTDWDTLSRWSYFRKRRQKEQGPRSPTETRDTWTEEMLKYTAYSCTMTAGLTSLILIDDGN